MNVKELLVKDKKNMIICPSSYNEGIFKSLKDEFLYNLTFETPENFVTEVLGSYLDNLVMKLEEGEDKDFGPLNVSGAKELIGIASFLDDKDFKDKHIKYFVKNEGYIECLKEMNIVYIDYCLSNLHFHLALNELKKNGIEAKLYKPEQYNKELILVNNGNIIEEVENTVDLVSDLLYKGKDINDIIVYVSNEEYYSVFEDVLSYTDISYQIERNVSLFETVDCLNFFNFAKVYSESNNKLDIEVLKLYKEKYPSINLNTYNTLVSFFSGIEYSSIDYLREFLLNAHIKVDTYKNVLKITSNFDKYIEPNKVLFMCGINQGLFPSTIRYNGLITDEIIEKKNLPTSKVLNGYNEDYIKNKINSIETVYISTCKKNMAKELSPSSFIEKLGLKKEDALNHSLIKGYSKKRDFLKYLKAKDTYFLYHHESDNLKKYNFLKDEIEEIKYESNFKFDNFELFSKIINKELKLSYSTISDYASCPFKYLFKNTLKLEEFDVKYANFLGDFFHKFIKKYINIDFDQADVQLMLEDHIKKVKEDSKYELSDTEKVFFEIFYDTLPIIHEKLRSYFDRDNLKLEREKPFHKDLKSDKLTVYVKGYIDLVAENKDDNSLFVFDYKTGKIPDIDLEKREGLQLLIYMDALLNDGYKNDNPAGIIYIDINHKPSEFDPDSNIKFSGYSILKKDKSIEIFNNIVNQKRKYTIGCSDDLRLRIEDTNKIVDEIKNDIINQKFIQTPSEDACKYCNFNEFCYSKKVNTYGEDDEKEEITNGDK